MGEHGRGGSRSQCDRCGDAFDVSEWHPAELVEADDGDVHLVEFCSTECRERWADADDDDGGPTDETAVRNDPDRC